MADMDLISLTTLGTFIAASVGLAFAPGPDNIFVLTQAALHGRQAGMFVTLGLCTGLIVHTAAVALGVAALFATSETAFTGLKIAGSAYLIYLAWGAWGTRAGNSKIDVQDGPRLSEWSLYCRGVIMNITNPKVAIFFLAFLPSFTNPEAGSVMLQVLILGVVFMSATMICFGSIAVFAGSVGELLKRSPNAQTVLNRIAGVIFIGLAIRLLLTERV